LLSSMFMPTTSFIETSSPRMSSSTPMDILYSVISAFPGCLTTLPRTRILRVVVLAHLHSLPQKSSLKRIMASKRTFGLSVLSSTKCWPAAYVVLGSLFCFVSHSLLGAISNTHCFDR
jgi:hypothetical protein